jgi:ABC-type protease/lipase transport system fused ATPase/permease subunit
VRSRILINFGSQIDEESKGKVFECLFKYGPEGKSLGSSQGIRDLETVRQFFSGNSLFVFYDAPWVPLFIGLIFIIHPLLGTVSLIGSVVIFLIAIATEFSSRKILKEAANYAVQSSIFAESSLRNSDVLHAMGMIQNVTQRWQEIHNPMVDLQAKANSRVGILVGFSRHSIFKFKY